MLRKFLIAACLFLAARVYSDDCCSTQIGPCSFIPWASYTHFCIDDDRRDSAGDAFGENVLFGFSYYLRSCLSVDLYGVWEHSENLSRPTANGDALFRAVNRARGWGGGGQINYHFCPGWTAYVDLAYVSVRQHLRTVDLTLTFPDLLSTIIGHRWTVIGGINAVFSCQCFTLSGDVNYLYVSNHLGGSVDTLGQRLTGQNASLGTLSGSGAVFFWPACCINPFVSLGIAYDVNRHNEFPTFFPASGFIQPFEVTAPLRDRFEWNAGAGVLLKKSVFSFSAAYLFKRRPGPIKTHVISVYASLIF